MKKAKTPNRAAIKKAICPAGPKTAAIEAPAQTMLQVFEALHKGLGIRKKHWNRGYFVYLTKAGVIVGGQLSKPCRDDASPAKEITFGSDASIWEIVTPDYAAEFVKAANRESLLKAVLARASDLRAHDDEKLVAVVAKALKVTLPAALPC